MDKKNPVVAMLNCHDDDVYCFRREIIDDLADRGYTVLVSCPYGKRIEKIRRENVVYEDVEIDRRGTNPIHDLALYRSYLKLFRKYRPAIVLAFTIKPNIYGGLAAKRLGIPYVNNITGLGSGFENGGIVKQIILTMYRVVLNSARHVFFQNSTNQKRILETGILKHDRYEVIPGSGVNLDRFRFCEYPAEGKLIINYIGRVMKDKNIDDFLYAAGEMKKRHDDLEFRVIGFIEETEPEYRQILTDLEAQGIIRYLGPQEDVRPLIEESSAILHPSTYGEGLSNVLLESMATGRVLLTTTVPGCGETVEDGVNGFRFAPHDRTMMLEALERFIRLPYAEKCEMGRASRRLAEERFSRGIVVEKYRSLVQTVAAEDAPAARTGRTEKR